VERLPWRGGSGPAPAVRTGGLIRGAASLAGVYALEFVGEDDDLPALEAGAVAPDVDVVAPGLATAGTVALERVPDLAFVRAVVELVARTDADVAAAAAALDAAPLDREGNVAVRARDVRGSAGVSTDRAERELGAALVERGFDVDLEDPDHELRALFAARTGGADGAVRDADDPGVCLLGWTAAESVRDFGERAPTDRPFFQPGSMDPMLARAVVDIAGAREGATVLDPMCGTGGLLAEAGLVGARVVGTDAQRKMVRGTRRNLEAALDGWWSVARADATRLPLADDAADAAVFDVPYERQSAVAGDSLSALVAGALAETRRVADRAVVVGDRDWSDAARDAGWSVEAVVRRRVHGSLVRHVHALE
jgi:tRNA (guanine10-N2)-dimethyltransferase